jgi:phosphoesterase RecJ-like protein
LTDAVRENFEAAKALIAKSKRVLISGHLSPDGDSLGCMIAMARMLTAAGYEAFATADVNALGKPGFLEGVADIIPVRKLKRRRFDLFIAVDCAAFERMPPEVRPVAEKLPKICIDHHVTNDGSFGDVQLVDATASSAAEIVWSFAKWMQWPFDRAIAEALWVAMITDTGRFAYDSTTSETMCAAGDLLKYGVRTAWINDIIYGTFPRKAMELKRRAWRKLHIWKNRRVAEVSLTRDDFRSVRGNKADAEDIIEIPRAVARNEIALFFYQIPDRTKETRCSIRTRGDWDATVLAAKFGGGGHRKAAGCTIKATMGVAKRQMRKAVKDMLYPPKKAAKAETAAPPPPPPPPSPPQAVPEAPVTPQSPEPCQSAPSS